MSADLENAAKKLDKVVHGLEDAKSAVLQIVGQVIRAPDAPVRALGLCGPPGCGKTSLAVRGIGAALKDRPVRVIGLGGAKDSSVLLGHDFTYSGSRPGRVIDAVCSAGVSDCVLVFDELDKLSDTASGKEVASVLMSIVDPTQNKAFEDTYLIGVPIDLSRVVCVFTFNDISLVDPILLDRLHIVHVHELSVAEKKKVVQSRMLPEIAKSLGVDNVTIDDECVTLLLQNLKGGSFRGAEKALEHAILSANVRTIREKRSVDGSNPMKIEHDDLPKHPTSKDFISTMYA
jgi:ATP-dependent Lon protease